MRNWKAWALGLGALGLVGLFFHTGNNHTAVAQTEDAPFSRPASIMGYFAVVDSLWSNDASGDIAYHVVNAPSGYGFDSFQLIGYNNGAAESFSVRPWYSATDSTSILTDALTYYFASADMQVRSLPIRCHKLSVVGLSSVSDVRILGFCIRR